MRESGVYKKGELDLMKAIEEAPAGCAGDAGVIYYYLGVARRTSRFSPEGVKEVVIESYEEYASAALRRICEELKAKHGIIGCWIYHLEGSFRPSEPMVLIIICSGHRREGLAALEEAIERYKREPTIWKKEVYESGAQKWIEE